MTEAPLEEVVQLLRAADVAFMLVGSYASAHYGAARATQDVDVVVELDVAGLDRLLEHLDDARFYVPRETAAAAADRGGQFNVIDLETGWKIDLIVRRERPFSRTEFDRRRAATVSGVDVFVASPEDTVLSKLEWARAGGSDRQLADAAEVLAVVGHAIDDEYLDRWAAVLDVADLLDAARRDEVP